MGLVSAQVFLHRVRSTVVNSTIQDNKATFAGGGICVFHSDEVRIEGSTINGNRAGIQGGGINFQGRSGSLGASSVETRRLKMNGERIVEPGVPE